MKKSQDVIGLPVFSIVNGIKIGQVKDLVINPEEGKVDFILVSDGSWYVGAKVLPFKDVMGIGEYALTIESENMLLNIDNSDANNLLNRNIEIKGNRVLTNKGNLIGIINEYEFDENTGSLHKIEYKNSQGENKIETILATDVLTFGTDVVVVKEQTDNSQVESISNNQLDENNNSLKESKGAVLFKKQQRSYLLGKKLTRDIKNTDGSILFKAGQEITEYMLDLAEKNNKLADLSESLE